MVAKILRGDGIAPDIKVEYPAKVTVDLNDQVAQTLGIIFPESLKKKPLESTGDKL
jgi:ABC-type uncharacterized transport system substrate-binding protein